jgi:hypothetical protein
MTLDLGYWLVRSAVGAYLSRMAHPGRASSAPPQAEQATGPRLRVHPEDEAELSAAQKEIAAGRLVDLTPEELAEWEATGELPASVEARFAALGCRESQD